MPRRRRWIVASILLAIGGVVAILAIARPGGRLVYTDAETIRQPANAAPLRDILWQPPTPMSIDQADDSDSYEPTLSADGQVLVFVRGRAGGMADLYVCRRSLQGWSEPAPLLEINTPADELGPCLSADSTALYYYSDRTGGEGGYDLWVAERRGPDELFDEPCNLGPTVNSPYQEYSPALSADGQSLYFASDRPKAGMPAPRAGGWPATLREDRARRDYDLYATSWDAGRWNGPEPLAALNSAWNEGTPAVSPVGDFLYFSSDRPGGLGSFDLYRARRTRGVLACAESLGSPVNTSANELDPALGMGGYALYFSSDRADWEGPALELAALKPSSPRYALFTTTSREVFREREPLTSSFSLGAVWRQIWRQLLLALLALAISALLIWLLRRWGGSAMQRKLSLLARCILISLLVHALLVSSFTVWGVTTAVVGLWRQSGGVKVVLNRAQGSDQLVRQIRGGYAPFEAPDNPLSDRASALNHSVPLDASMASLTPPRPAPVVEGSQVLEVQFAKAAPAQMLSHAWDISQLPVRPHDVTLEVDTPAPQAPPAVANPAPDAAPPIPTTASPYRLAGTPSAVAFEPQQSELPRASLPTTATTNSSIAQPAADPASTVRLPTLPLATTPATASPQAEIAPSMPAPPPPSSVAQPAVAEALVALPVSTLATVRPATPIDVHMPADNAAPPTAITDAVPTAVAPPAVAIAPPQAAPAMLPAPASAPSDSKLAVATPVVAPPAPDRATTAQDSAADARAAMLTPTLARSPLPGVRAAPPVEALNSLEQPKAQPVIEASAPIGIETAALARAPMPRMPMPVPPIDPLAASRPVEPAVPPQEASQGQAAIGQVIGKVTDADSELPLPAAIIRLDLAESASVEVKTDADGAYALHVPPVPDFFAISATLPGYVAASANVSAKAVEHGAVRVDFKLKPLDLDTLVLEVHPEVHHLGDDAFDGSINSRFQKRAEARLYRVTFAVDEARLTRGRRGAELALLAKGVQMPHPVLINGTRLPRTLPVSPDDGSFGEVRLDFPIELLQIGENTLEIRDLRRGDDHDDFEFINVQVRLKSTPARQ
jgi:hypothetical protein